MKAADAVILGKTNVPVLSHTGSHANDSWAGPTLMSRPPTCCRAAAVPARRPRSRPASPFSALPRRPAARSRIRPPRRVSSASSRPSRWCPMPASCRWRPIATSSARIARCVRDAALTLDVLAGYTSEDPKTIAGVGRKPRGGYAAKLNRARASGQAHRPLWPGLAQPAALGRRPPPFTSGAQTELAAQGAILVADPFAGSGFAELRRRLCRVMITMRAVWNPSPTICRNTWSVWGRARR